MPFLLDDTTPPPLSASGLSLKQTLNAIAYLLKKITGGSSWRDSPPIPLSQVTPSNFKGDKGDTGATGATGIQGLKGDKGDTGATGATGTQGTPGTVTIGAWQNLSLFTNWSNYSPGYSTAQCRLYFNGLVEVKGVVKKSTTLIANETIANLPTGYAPSETMLITTYASGGTSRLQIETSGAIKVLCGNNGGVGIGFIFGLG